MKNMSAKFLGILSLTLLMSSIDALACGESLFRVGRGMSFRHYSAPIPANVLVYAESEGEKAMAAQLADAGHMLYIASSNDELITELKKGSFEVVIAPFSIKDSVQSAIGDTSSKTVYLPVVESGTDGEQLVETKHPRFVTDDSSLKNILKAIHKIVKNV